MWFLQAQRFFPDTALTDRPLLWRRSVASEVETMFLYTITMNFVFIRVTSFTVMHGYHHWQTRDKIIYLFI